MHDELMVACALVLQRAMRPPAAEAAGGVSSRRSAAARLQHANGMQQGSLGGLDEQAQQWLDALLKRLDECISQWLQGAAATVAAAHPSSQLHGAVPAASIMGLLAKLSAHRDDFVKHLEARAQEQQSQELAAAAAGVGGRRMGGQAIDSSNWLASMLVMWRWFLKDAAALMYESGEPIGFESLKGHDRRSKSLGGSKPGDGPQVLKDAGSLKMAAGDGLEWPGDADAPGRVSALLGSARHVALAVWWAPEDAEHR